jgi:hypothetical protein
MQVDTIFEEARGKKVERKFFVLRQEECSNLFGAAVSLFWDQRPKRLRKSKVAGCSMLSTCMKAVRLQVASQFPRAL